MTDAFLEDIIKEVDQDNVSAHPDEDSCTIQYLVLFINILHTLVVISWNAVKHNCVPS